MPTPPPIAPPGDARVSTGNPELDQILNGGLLPRRPYLIVGPAGTGKTTLALQFLCEGVRRGENCLLVTLEEPPNEMRVNHPALHPEMDRVYVFDAIPDVMRYERAPFKDIAAVRQSVLFGTVPLDIRRTPELSSVEVTFTALEQTLKMEAARRPYSRLVIDSLTALQYFCMKGVDEMLGAQTFLRFLSDLKITTILTVEAPLEDVESPERLLARGEVRLFRWELDGRTVRAVGVEKFRGSPHDVRLHPYRIAPTGLAINLGVTISRDTRQVLEVGPGPPPPPAPPVPAVAELDPVSAFAGFLQRDVEALVAAHADLRPIQATVAEANGALASNDAVSAWTALRAARRIADQRLFPGERPQVPPTALDASPPSIPRIRELVEQLATLIGPLPAPVPAPQPSPVAAPTTVSVGPIPPGGVPPPLLAIPQVVPITASVGSSEPEPPAPPPPWPGENVGLVTPAVEMKSPMPPAAVAPNPAPNVSPAAPLHPAPPSPPRRAGSARSPLGRTASRIVSAFSRGGPGRHPESVPSANASPAPISPAEPVPPSPPAAAPPPEAPPLPQPRDAVPPFDLPESIEPVSEGFTHVDTGSTGEGGPPVEPADVASSPPTSSTPPDRPPAAVDSRGAPPLAQTSPAPEPPSPAPGATSMDATVAETPALATGAGSVDSAPAVADPPAPASPPTPKRRRRSPPAGTPRRRTPSPAPASTAPEVAAPVIPPPPGPALAATPVTTAPIPVTAVESAPEPASKPKRRAPRKRKAPSVVSAAPGTGPPEAETTTSPPAPSAEGRASETANASAEAATPPPASSPPGGG